MMWRVLRSYAIPICFVMLLAGSCGASPVPKSQRDDVAALESVFPLLEALGVETFRDQPNCHVLQYRGGAFAEPQDFNCSLVAEPVSPFSESARRDFVSLEQALSVTRVSVEVVWMIHYDADGRLAKAEFGLVGTRDEVRAYLYQPGEEVPPDHRNESTFDRIDDSWVMWSADPN